MTDRPLVHCAAPPLAFRSLSSTIPGRPASAKNESRCCRKTVGIWMWLPSAMLGTTSSSWAWPPLTRANSTMMAGVTAVRWPLMHRADSTRCLLRSPGFIGAHLSARWPDMFDSVCLRNPVIDLPSCFATSDIPDWCVSIRHVVESHKYLTDVLLCRSQVRRAIRGAIRFCQPTVFRADWR